MVRKIFDAAGLIALPIIAYFAFDPDLPVNTPESLFALLAMYCLAPLALWIIATYIIWKYPITPERQARLRAGLDRREQRQALTMSSSD
jgi:Na+/melibiose symporter-like transporter